MHVEHFMTKEVVSVNRNASCHEAASLMEERNVGCVVVVDDAERVIGIATDRDLALGVCARNVTAGDVPIEQIMTKSPATVTLDDTLFSVLDTMRTANTARRIPVVDGEKHLVGIVSVSDVAVITNKLITEVLREQTHHSLEEAQPLTGGKRIQKEIGSPQGKAAGQSNPTTSGSQGRAPSAGGRTGGNR